MNPYSCSLWLLSAVGRYKKDSISYNVDRIRKLTADADRRGQKKVKLPCPYQLALAAVSLFGHIAPGQREPMRVDSLWIIPFIPADFQFTKEMLLCGAVLLLIVCRHHTPRKSGFTSRLEVRASSLWTVPEAHKTRITNLEGYRKSLVKITHHPSPKSCCLSSSSAVFRERNKKTVKIQSKFVSRLLTSMEKGTEKSFSCLH